MAYYLALVSPSETTFNPVTHKRMDEKVRSFTVSQNESDFCGLTMTIEKPSASLLDPLRNQWAWLSMDVGLSVTPLFFGRIVGIPTNIQGDFVTVEFLAKPTDFDTAKRTLAGTLRVLPWFDYAFIDPQSWDDPDVVLEARTDVWNIDRITHAVTITSLIQGEDGTISIAASDVPSDGFSLTYGEAPLRKVTLDMRAMWTQIVNGTIDITDDVLAAFAASGSKPGYVQSYTGDGLYNDWPEKGDDIGNIYSFGPQVINVADGKQIGKAYLSHAVKYERAPSPGSTVAPDPLVIYFRKWAFTITSLVDYEADLDRIEDIRFEVLADIQSVTSDDLSDVVSMSSGNIGTEVGVSPTTEIPIGDISRDFYFATPRGRQSIEYGLAHARAMLLRRARAVEINVSVPLSLARTASCRKSATVTHPGLPGGSATGKIVGYSFGVDGETGSEFGTITIACMVGNNTPIAALGGTPTYAEATYVGPDYQEFTGGLVLTGNSDMAYSPPITAAVVPIDPGLLSVTVTNGVTAQKAALGSNSIDIAAACDKINAVFTQVDLKMKPVDLSPRTFSYGSSDVVLTIPMGVDLGA